MAFPIFITLKKYNVQLDLAFLSEEQKFKLLHLLYVPLLKARYHLLSDVILCLRNNIIMMYFDRYLSCFGNKIQIILANLYKLKIETPFTQVPYGHHINLKSLKTSMTLKFVIILQNLIKAYQMSGLTELDVEITRIRSRVNGV